MKYKCPCCGYYTFTSPLKDCCGEICEVCFWEIDFLAPKEDSYSGANHGLTLIEARENFHQFGACKDTMVKYLRKPRPDELCEEE